MDVQTHKTTDWSFVITATLASGLLFVLFHRLNAWLFSAVEVTHQVNWVFLPSGLRLLLILLLDKWGALGIVLGGFWLSIDAEDFEWDHLISPILSGGAPYVVYLWMKNWQASLEATEAERLEAPRCLAGDDLSGLTPACLVKLSMGFALVSATAHQVWFALDQSDWASLMGWVPMFVGDVLGNFIMLSLFWLFGDTRCGCPDP
jgi:hypothetical protein